MAYKVNVGTFENVVRGYLDLCKKLSGELVILNKKDDEADEYVISSIKDLKYLDIKNKDLLEVTIYVDDEDEVFDEFVIGINDDTKILEKNLFSKFPNKIEIVPDKEKAQKEKIENNHFAKFMKKKK
ncbi:hypothetical protein SAMN02745174_01428 [Cetobacterium ceti]|uniref:Uncharacterized protein n=1 Tax=Cetobacterium ceti TaxID=180163 RepID=A0A1T4N6P1_9FUSO|nr:hypothetical protein [Cetobacterium ceti]SJZ74518.1 hypothetical protein SAMN02745174_01428 [Cetobacterium ceti]